MINEEQFSVTAPKRHSSDYFSQNLFEDDEMQKQIRRGLQIISMHRLVQRFSMHQTKEIIKILQIPSTKPNFLQLKYG